MTADLTPALTAEPNTTPTAPPAAVEPARWQVIRQDCHHGLVEHPVSSHRWEWVAQLWAHHRERGHAHEAGGHYTIRRADT